MGTALVLPSAALCLTCSVWPGYSLVPRITQLPTQPFWQQKLSPTGPPVTSSLPAPCLCPAFALSQSWFSNSLFSTLTIPLDKTRVGFYLMDWSMATFWACKVSKALLSLLLFLSHQIWLQQDHRLPSCAFLILASFTLLFWKSPEHLCNHSLLLWKQRDNMHRSWRTKNILYSLHPIAPRSFS